MEPSVIRWYLEFTIVFHLDWLPSKVKRFRITSDFNHVKGWGEDNFEMLMQLTRSEFEHG